MATRRVSVAPREAVVGIDTLEQKVTYFGVVLGFVMSLSSVYLWFNGAQHSRVGYAIQFAFIIGCSIAMLFFATKRKRSGVIVSSLLLGMYLQLAGVAFLYIGIWLLIRAYRLQKYGDPTLFGSSRIQRELSQARRAGKAITAEEAAEKAKVEINTPRPAVRESSRYTPKRNTQRRRK